MSQQYSILACVQYLISDRQRYHRNLSVGCVRCVTAARGERCCRRTVRGLFRDPRVLRQIRRICRTLETLIEGGRTIRLLVAGLDITYLEIDQQHSDLTIRRASGIIA